MYRVQSRRSLWNTIVRVTCDWTTSTIWDFDVGAHIAHLYIRNQGNEEMIDQLRRWVDAYSQANNTKGSPEISLRQTCYPEAVVGALLDWGGYAGYGTSVRHGVLNGPILSIPGSTAEDECIDLFHTIQSYAPI